MSETKKTASEVLVPLLKAYAERLAGSGSADEFKDELGAFLAPRIAAKRLLRQHEGAAGGMEDVKVDFVEFVSEPEEILKVGGIYGLDVRLPITLKEDGTVSLAFENDTILEGQDLSLLAEASDASVEEMDFDDPITGEYYSAQELAERLGVDKSTITRRIKKNRLLGYRGFKRDWLIPKAQIRDQDVLPGIAEMIDLFEGEHKETWFFLSSRIFYGNDNPRPIDRLRAVKLGDASASARCITELEAAQNSYAHGDHV